MTDTPPHTQKAHYILDYLSLLTGYGGKVACTKDELIKYEDKKSFRVNSITDLSTNEVYECSDVIELFL